MENTLKIRSRVLAPFSGLMEGNILGIGRMENSMAMAPFALRPASPGEESG
jgi:hypothetical protein